MSQKQVVTISCCDLVAFNKIQHVYHVAIGRVIFRAWYAVMKDAKETREYFEVMIVEC